MSSPVRIPGLGYSLHEDGRWLDEEGKEERGELRSVPSTKAARRKAEEDSIKAERLRALWKAMAYG